MNSMTNIFDLYEIILDSEGLTMTILNAQTFEYMLMIATVNCYEFDLFNLNTKD